MTFGRKKSTRSQIMRLAADGNSVVRKEWRNAFFLFFSPTLIFMKYQRGWWDRREGISMDLAWKR